MKKRKTKIVRKKVVSKATLQSQIVDLTGRCEWATRIITMQQAEIDRMTKQCERLVEAIGRTTNA